MHKGYLCIVLHAHLPFIRHPEYEYFLEENWLFEAITETYIPLLDVFIRLLNEGIDFRITISLSPTLIEMLNDRLLRNRYKRHIENLIDLSDKEVYRTRGDINFEPVTRMYNERFRRIRYLFEDLYHRDIVAAFKALEQTGKIEIITSAATHAFLPTLSKYPQAVRAQIKIGSALYRKFFRKEPEGIWLPECGYEPGFDNYLKEEDIKFFFLETHGITCGNPSPGFNVYAPVVCPSGVFAFGRDVESSQQVWSSIFGYPGDFDYRDFYRDIGYDLECGHIKAFINQFGTKTYTGLKYYRITGKTDHKEPYVIEQAKEKASEHANNFIQNRELQIDFLSQTLKIKPVITATYDTELFGHWWFEGPEWLYFLFRGISRTRRNFKTVTPSEYLHLNTHQTEYLQACQPSMSSWGYKGYSEVWLNESNDYVYPHILKATERMIYLADKFFEADNIQKRTLNQAARELLLSQQSDWTFMIRTGNTSEYARKRFAEHIGRFNYLYHSIITGNISREKLKEIEDIDNIFQKIDYRYFKSENDD
ncbi:MAG: DUF1957 domain-containing protein [Nitrospirae bacterium]|jgi:1,4-alpha-glucan branching enzyme|nr:DUF1957 domain-containing protein [Nitrospirota bacterium]